jgi:hypothetical protein
MSIKADLQPARTLQLPTIIVGVVCFLASLVLLQSCDIEPRGPYTGGHAVSR